MTPKEIIQTGTITAEILRPTEASFENTLATILTIEQEAFGDNAFSPELLRADLSKPQNTAVILKNEIEEVIGFTYTEPLNFLDKDDLTKIPRGDGGQRTAYISDIVIRERYRHKGLVAKMMTLLEEELKKRGFESIEADFEEMFGRKVAKAYPADRIVYQGEPHGSSYGQQIFFRISL